MTAGVSLTHVDRGGAADRAGLRAGDRLLAINGHEVADQIDVRFYSSALRLRLEWGRADEPFEIKVVCGDVFDADGFRRLEDAGVTDCITMPWYLYGGDVHDLEVKTAALKRFSDSVISRTNPR